MADSNHYNTLNVNPNASQAEIKQAYRRLAKQYHPDSNQGAVDREGIIRINAAYEVLGDTNNRQHYDRQIYYKCPESSIPRQERTVKVQNQHRVQICTGRYLDKQVEEWLYLVYHPVNRLLNPIFKSLKPQIDKLAADPFDNRLLGDFQEYLENCCRDVKYAQSIFGSLPNPPSLARAAAHLYYCLNQMNDGLNELEYFPISYNESYLHAGLEMFYTAHNLYMEVKESVI